MLHLRIAAIAIAVAGASGCASDNWTRADTRRELAYIAVSTIDAVQTSQIRHSPYEEVDPLGRAVLGAKPSVADTAVYFVSLQMSHYLISRALPPKWRKYWQYATITTGSAYVISNCNLGLLCE